MHYRIPENHDKSTFAMFPDMAFDVNVNVNANASVNLNVNGNVNVNVNTNPSMNE